MIMKPVDILKRGLVKFRGNLFALQHNNITLRQVPYMIREWRLWLQITRNFKTIEGSWLGGLKTYLSIFEGFTVKKDRK